MSPLWHNRLLIAIGPGQISLFMLKRGFKPRVLARRDEVIDQSAFAPPWQALAAKLTELLAEPEWQAKEADIVLSNKLVRHTIIPFGPQLKKYSEREAFARHVLTKTYGAVAGQWELRIEQQGKAGPAIVSAMDRTLLASLQQTLVASNTKLRSLMSRLMWEYNHHRAAIQAFPSWLIVHESDHFQFALLDKGRIVSITGTTHPTLQALPALLDRENLAATSTEQCKTVYLSSLDGAAQAALGNQYTIFPLDALQPQTALSLSERVSLLLPRKKGTGRIVLDFQKPAYQPNKNAGWMLLMAGVALTLEMGISYGRLHNDRIAMEREIAESKIDLDEAVPDPRLAQYTEKDFDAARKIVSRLATPWEAFFSGLESVSNKHVAILSVVPDMQTGVLRVVGEAKDYAALLTLVAQLRTTKPFSEVYLSSQATKQGDPQHSIEFTIYMHWGKEA